MAVRIHRQWFILGGASLIFLVAGSALGVSEIEKSSRGPAYHLTATCLRVNAQRQVAAGRDHRLRPAIRAGARELGRHR